MKTKIVVIVFALVSAGLFLMTRFVTSSYDGPDLPLYTVSERSFEVMVDTIGVLDAARSHMVSSTIRGDKGKVIFLIDEGTRVQEGDVLVRLDPTPFEEEVHRLKGEVLSLEAAVDAAGQILEWEKSQVEREVKTADFNLKVSELDLKRLVEGDGPLQLAQLKGEMEKAKEEHTRYASYLADLEILGKQGVDTLTEIKLAKDKTSELTEKYDAASKKYTSYKEHVLPSLVETARANVGKAKMELEQIRKASVYKIAKATSALKEVEGKFQTAQTSLRQAESELKKTTILAPFPGIAVLCEAFRDGQKRKPRVGDRVWQNQPLLYLPDISSMIVKTRVREVDLHKIGIGQNCSVRVDAYPDVLFQGEVGFVGVMASGRFEGGAGEKYFQMAVSLAEEDTRLRPGMTARVSILTDQVKDVLCVPIHSIFDDRGEKYCYKWRGKDFKKVAIVMGRLNEDFAEIRSGLKVGEQVSLVEPSQ
jgi:HlyD family secretion protein